MPLTRTPADEEAFQALLSEEERAQVACGRTSNHAKRKRIDPVREKCLRCGAEIISPAPPPRLSLEETLRIRNRPRAYKKDVG